MKIIYAGIQEEKYESWRRFSFEYSNFYLQLKSMAGVEIIEYPYDVIIKIGKERFNRELLELIERENPDLFFAFMYTDEFDKKTLEAIKRKTKSVAWFADDHWRLPNYSRFYAPHFTWVVTTWGKAPELYARYGIKNVIRSQWACNTGEWGPVNVPRDIDVSFVGQMTPTRRKIIERLKSLGINVYLKGVGWPGGKVTHKEMVNIFSRSKINLNLNPPPSLAYWKVLARLFFKRSAGKIVPDIFHLKSNAKSMLSMSIPQIKARPFEVLGCRAFLISGYADDMARYYENGKEIVYYDGTAADLADKIKYYLNHGEEREKIAEAGYKRTLLEHTYGKRFEEIFDKIGLKL